MELYTQIMDNAGPSFRIILHHIRDNPNSGCIFHCTAGKDRTGVLAALLLKVCVAVLDDRPSDQCASSQAWITKP